MRRYILLTILITVCTFHKVSAQNNEMLIRISEIKIHKDSLMQYKAILKEEAEASLRLEPGVISIFPMYEKRDTTQIRILEIYDSQKAYESHLKTPHFKHYKTRTIKMVRSLELIDMKAIDSTAMKEIFKKLSH